MFAALRLSMLAIMLALVASPSGATLLVPKVDGLVMEFPPEQQQRRTMPDGTEYFGLSGTIRNDSAQEVVVPDLLIVLRDEQERTVYEAIISPPRRRIEAGASITVSQGFADVPASARYVEIGWVS
ncbi:hypothetical protein D2V07_02120 [Aurantiacibacter zhengii]|uniref:DUF3426 domain-containing protein n=2 Tax=Aurantiacibacter zhengii TaxID=2307003 RepID=A0A418NWU0_9SPHN|nr:hypothetical protein D2V07_02120 [Aurantiacibacter zhengii]